jgi:hypothetical protein
MPHGDEMPPRTNPAIPPKDSDKTFGKLVQKTRNERGWTLPDLARACYRVGYKIESSTIGGIEAGNARTSVRGLWAICMAFGWQDRVAWEAMCLAADPTIEPRMRSGPVDGGAP